MNLSNFGEFNANSGEYRLSKCVRCVAPCAEHPPSSTNAVYRQAWIEATLELLETCSQRLGVAHHGQSPVRIGDDVHTLGQFWGCCLFLTWCRLWGCDASLFLNVLPLHAASDALVNVEVRVKVVNHAVAVVIVEGLEVGDDVLHHDLRFGCYPVVTLASVLVSRLVAELLTAFALLTDKT